MSIAAPPLAGLRWLTAALAGYGLAALLWLLLGDDLPGGRWFAVHLFSVGVLSNAIVALTDHFGRALTKTGLPDRRAIRLVALNLGAVGVLSFPVGWGWPPVAGGVLVLGVVAWLAVDLRRMAATALGTRFVFIVNGYVAACAAFLGGTMVGTLLAAGAIPASWYGAARTTHLHLNILGWGGLTLLATVVFFGPTLMRIRMRDGADVLAARALPAATAGLAVAATGLLTMPANPTVGRVTAGLGLAVFAAAATAVCADVLRAGRAAKPAVHSWMIQAACVWFVAVVWADVVVVAAQWYRLLDALGVALIVGVLGQAIIASVNYLTPMVWVGGPDARNTARERLEQLGAGRAALLNAGAALVVVSAAVGPAWGASGAAVARSGWVLVGAVVVAQLGLSVLAVGRARDVR